MKVLFIGDIVGNPGRDIVSRVVPVLRKEHHLDFVIANAENAAGGSGITPSIAKELFGYGVDVLTSGDHIWKKREVLEVIDTEPRLLRPINFPEGASGKGRGLYATPSGENIGVINANGRVFMQALDCPFRATRAAVEELRRSTKVIIVDIHAEATSEKMALGWYLDGKVSAVLGTHTHVQTADERILPQGTAYITDVGMCGPMDSVIGRRVEDVIPRFLSGMPLRFEVAAGNVQLSGVVLDIDSGTGSTRSIARIQKK
ncbi:MAG: TIGR00282 family metallophosphoesterase [Candidatus Omnitrophica bacterium]|nr:TIGR00282 family metallophosphoesterase [Candidatus Omnitrophota bacterium]MDD5610716.1 TIGR00282 family metallophosphoesterase [Candidatus Omnitrophota bacterium]